MRSYVDLLRREGDFRRVYISQLVSLGGDWFALIPLLTLLERETGSGLWGGLVLAADTAVFALVSPYAGTVVDRVDRRRIMVLADIASAALVCVLLLVRGPATAWIALVAIGGIAVAKAFYSPASSAALPNLVPRADLAAANVLAGASWGTMLAVGAAAGGLLAAAVGESWCFGLDAASFLLSAVLTARTSLPFQEARERHERRRMREDIAETIAYARTEPRVVALLACKIGPGLGNGALALFPVFVSKVYQGTAAATGLLFSARGLGALVGPFLMRRVTRRDEARLWPALGVSMALFGLGYMTFAVVPSLVWALPVVFVAHVGGGANWILSTFGIQAIVPDHVRGRVFAADYMIATAGIAVSQLVTGVLSDAFDVRPVAFGLGAVVLGYAGLWSLATRHVRHVAAAPEPVGSTAEGEVA